MSLINSLRNNLFTRDIPKWLYFVIAFVAVCGKLILALVQHIYLALPAPIDDGLMYEAALSLTKGDWLGEYGHLTLSKHMGFAFWEALLHTLSIPILVGNQLFIAMVCLLSVLALSVVVHQQWQKLCLFIILLYNPATVAEFTLRPYRDSIFGYLCLAIFVCFIAVALRINQDIKKSLPYLIIGGLTLGWAVLFREDGYWVFPFTIVAGIITVIYLIKEKRATIKRLVCLLIPYVITAALILLYCGMNLIYYGRFIISDFSSGEFSAVIGAMTRVEPADEEVFWSDEKISIPYSVRRQLYDNVQLLTPFEEHLESEDFFNRYGYVQTNPETGEQYIDYSSGGFYWALRDAANRLSIYEDAITAQQFWQNVADEINYLCDENILPSRFGERNSTMPPIRSSYILPVIGEAVNSFWYTLTFQDTSCYMSEHRTFGEPADIVAMEEFLHSTANVAAVAGGTAPYYHPISLLIYRVFDALRLPYMFLIPIAFLAAIVVQIKRIKDLKNGLTRDTLLWLISFGIIMMAIFRCFIIAFVQVASFTIDTYVMYLSTIHPLILLFILLTFLAKTNFKVEPYLKTPRNR